MTPKEKATELIYKFTPYSDYNECDVFTERENQLKNAIQCALICVGEMLKLAYDIEWEKKEDAVSKLKFLKEVKQEINKL